MALRGSVLTVLALSLFASSHAQEPSPAAPTANPPAEGERKEGKGPHGRGPDGKGRPDWRGERKNRESLTPEQMRERAMRDLEKLTPEQRHEVWRAVWAVLNLSSERREELIGNEDERRKKVREEIDEMLKRTGIQIPDDQRRRFFHRYFSGRRSIEEQLKKETEERRQVLMKEHEEKLKQEFGSARAVESLELK